MEQTQLTSAELVERFPQIDDQATAMKAVMDVLEERLRPNYQGLNVKPYSVREDVGFIAPEYESFLKGYHLVQRTQLEQPRTEIRRSLFGIIKTPVIHTHEERRLVYGSIKNSRLKVLVNDREVLQACEEVAKKTQGNVEVRLGI
jgi:hypothetical protein